MRLWLVAALLVAFLAGTLAKRRDRQASKQEKTACRYKKGKWSECDTDSNTQSRVMTLRRGNATECQTEVTEQRLCKIGRVNSAGKGRNRKRGQNGRRRGGGKKRGSKKACKYSKGEWADCDPVSGKKSRLLTLEDGDPKTCEATMIKTRNCKVRSRGQKGCKYSKGQWSQCDALHDVRTRIMTLKDGSPTECPQSYSLTKTCRKGSSCVYTKTRWGECDTLTKTQSSARTLQPGSPATCNSTITFTRKCRASRRAPRRNRQSNEKCRYTKAKWSECDDQNLQTRTLTLRKGNPAKCNMTEEKRACKIVCKYNKGGQWSDCDPTTTTKTRTDTLKEGSTASCNATRVKTRPCVVSRPGKCVYDKGTWSECNGDGKRVLTRKLVPGDDGGTCPQTKTKERTCLMKNGQMKCLYGPWGKFGDCQNGVRTKTREILAGGEKCQRKTVRLKPCTA